jgi:hypothetical protein
MTNIVVNKGEDKLLSLIIKDDDGVAVPLTDQTVRFRCRRSPDDNFLYELTNTSAQHDDAANGLTSFMLEKAVSIAATSQLYYWEIELENESSGFVSIQDDKGSLTIKTSV